MPPIFALILIAVMVATLTLSTTALAVWLKRRNAPSGYTVGWTGIAASALVPLGVILPLAIFPPQNAFFLRFGTAICGVCARFSLVFYVVLGLAALGFTVQILRLIFGITLSRGLLFSAKPLIRPDVHSRLDACRNRIDAAAYPVLFTSHRIRHPSIWCWGLHPAILLPESLDETLSPEETEAIFLHELGHLIRRDHLTGFAVRAAGLLLFWNPLYGRLARRLDTLCDTACDRFVLERSAMTPALYSEMLVRLAAEDKGTSVYQFFAQKETIMQRINALLSPTQTNQKSRPIFWLTLWTLPTALVTAALTLPILAATQENTPAATQASTSEVAALTDPVKRFSEQRRKMRAGLTSPTDAQRQAAESRLREIQAGFDAGNPQYDLFQIAEAKERLAQLSFAADSEQQYADEIIAARKLCYDTIKAQFDVGHPNGSALNLARATIDWKEAQLLYATPDSPISPKTVEELLAAADMLVRATQAAFDVGKASDSDRAEAKAEQARIERDYRALLDVLKNAPLENTSLENLPAGVRSYPVNRVVSDFSEAQNLDTPENAYAALMLRVVGEKDAKQARENFLTLDSVEAHGGAEAIKESDFAYNEAWAQVCRNAEIREVFVYQDRLAAVIAYLPGEEVCDPFDTRRMEKVDGRWLNLGNDRYPTLEDARAHLLKTIPFREK